MSEIRLEKLEELTRDSVTTDKLAMVVTNGQGSTADTSEILTALKQADGTQTPFFNQVKFYDQASGDVGFYGIASNDDISFSFTSYDSDNILKGRVAFDLEGAGFSASFGMSNLTASRIYQLPDNAGVLAAVTTYADETAANAAEAVNVLYFNTATGKFQITTA